MILKNKKASIGTGLNWMAAIIVIFFMMLIFISWIFVMASSDKFTKSKIEIGGKKISLKNNVATKNFMSFLQSEIEYEGEKRTVYATIPILIETEGLEPGEDPTGNIIATNGREFFFRIKGDYRFGFSVYDYERLKAERGESLLEAAFSKEELPIITTHGGLCLAQDYAFYNILSKDKKYYILYCQAD